MAKNKYNPTQTAPPATAVPPKPVLETPKPTAENGFFRKFSNPLRASPWERLVGTETLTPAQIGKLQALAVVRAAKITGGFALLAGLSAAAAVGFVWWEQKKLDSQTEELAKEKEKINKAQNDLRLQKSQQAFLSARLINVSADREGLHAGLQVSEKIIKDYCKGENTSCFQKHKEQITAAKKKAEIEEKENINAYINNTWDQNKQYRSNIK